MPCAAPSRNNLGALAACGKPIVMSLGGASYSASNRCLPHLAMQQGLARIPRPIISEGDVDPGWPTNMVYGTGNWAPPVFSITQQGGSLYPGFTPTNGSLVQFQINGVDVGEYLVTSDPYLSPGEASWMNGKYVGFHAINRAGADQSGLVAGAHNTPCNFAWRYT
jgi:hypothetical protein